MKKLLNIKWLMGMVFIVVTSGIFADEKLVEPGISWKGHDTFKLVINMRIIFTDPVNIKEVDKADLILISHEHPDHYSLEDLKKLSTKDTVIITTQKVLEDIQKNKGLNYKKIVVLKNNEGYNLDNIKITTVPAYNTMKERLNFHPKEAGNAGFLINYGKETVYFAGDTDRIEEMKQIKADIALLPVSGTYVMAADEAKEAALDINPKVVIPMHYGSGVGTVEDAKKLKELLAKSGINVIIK